MLWYRPGSGARLRCGSGRAAASFASRPGRVTPPTTTCSPATSTATATTTSSGTRGRRARRYLWRSDGDGTFTSLPLSPGAGRRPFLLDTNGDGDDEVFWYGPGSLPDAQWNWAGTGFIDVGSRRCRAATSRIVGDFDAQRPRGHLLVRPGRGGRLLWLHTLNGIDRRRAAKTVSAARTCPWWATSTGTTRDDIVWYAPGTGGDSAVVRRAGGAFASPAPLGERHLHARSWPTWSAPAATRDLVRARGRRRLECAGRRAERGRHPALYPPGQHRPVVGGFSAGGADGDRVVRAQRSPPTSSGTAEPPG